jgi:hypothetical protein
MLIQPKRSQTAMLVHMPKPPACSSTGAGESLSESRSSYGTSRADATARRGAVRPHTSPREGPPGNGVNLEVSS